MQALKKGFTSYMHDSQCLFCYNTYNRSCDPFGRSRLKVSGVDLYKTDFDR